MSSDCKVCRYEDDCGQRRKHEQELEDDMCWQFKLNTGILSSRNWT